MKTKIEKMYPFNTFKGETKKEIIDAVNFLMREEHEKHIRILKIINRKISFSKKSKPANYQLVKIRSYIDKIIKK